MKIVILAGGTGSIALQHGLYHELERNLDGIEVKVIVNAYDNGLSTGAVRQVMDGKILGPSDVRKNQTTRLALENPNSPWLKFLNIRFTKETSIVEDYCKDQLGKLGGELAHAGLPINLQDISDGIEEFFRCPIASRIDYNDFSLANIIYAGVARANGNSLRAAATIMARAMGIKDNVLLNDDTSLFLGAITKSGKRITDEGDIVSWGNVDDPFVDLFFTGADGEQTYPNFCHEARHAMIGADLIILSTGTQWSSLIPTYASRNFAETLERCRGQIIMLMNRQPDMDSPGQTASDIIDILVPRYFPAGKLKVVVDTKGHPQMNTIIGEAAKKIKGVYAYDMDRGFESKTPDRVHDSTKLMKAIATTYFDTYLDSDYFVFDYDDTLVGRGNVFPVSSKSNVARIVYGGKDRPPVAICSGNSIKAIRMQGDSAQKGSLKIFADGGVNLYEYPLSSSGNEDDGQPTKFIKCVDESVVLSADEVSAIASDLSKHGITRSKIENRGNTQIAIKPVDPEYRPAIVALIKMLIDDSKFDIKLAGRTTIEISKKGLSKVAAIRSIIEDHKPKQITFVGDEFHDGNDAPVKDVDGVYCLPVSDPSDTAFFLYALSSKYPWS